MKGRALGHLLVVAALTAPFVHSFSAEAQSTERQPRTQGGSLATLASRLADLPVGGGALVAVGPLGGQRLSEASVAALHDRLRAVVGSAVPGLVGRLEQPVSRQAARSAARKRDLTLVYLAPTLHGGKLSIAVDVVQWPRSFWQRALLPEGTTTHHRILSVEADSEIRRLLPRPEGLLATRHEFGAPLTDVVALACGDATGDGSNELLVVGRRELILGHFREGHFRSLAQRSWESLAPISPHPLQAPLATARIRPHELTVGLSDRAFGVQLDGELLPRGYLDWAAPFPASTCLDFTTTGLGATPRDCVEPSQQPPSLSRKAPRAASLDAWSRATVTNERGIEVRVTATVDTGGDEARVRVDSPLRESMRWRVPNIGESVALADLDGDGTAELVASRAVHSGEEDAVVVHSLEDSGPRLRTTVAGGPVHALCVCPFVGKNPQRVVASVGQRLWVLE